ncbi:hypothetical protein H4Q26_014640 [Puccinia striiformis f. sp. tritici PST-130]|nr:hypothetical protein H4Q26_014640 [Puccinia striiformis f. sp. tritici PST-130]
MSQLAYISWLSYRSGKCPHPPGLCKKKKKNCPTHPAVTPLLPHRFHLTHSVVIMRDKWKKKRVRRLKRKRRKMRARSSKMIDTPVPEHLPRTLTSQQGSRFETRPQHGTCWTSGRDDSVHPRPITQPPPSHVPPLIVAHPYVE